MTLLDTVQNLENAIEKRPTHIATLQMAEATLEKLQALCSIRGIEEPETAHDAGNLIYLQATLGYMGIMLKAEAKQGHHYTNTVMFTKRCVRLIKWFMNTDSTGFAENVA